MNTRQGPCPHTLVEYQFSTIIDQNLTVTIQQVRPWSEHSIRFKKLDRVCMKTARDFSSQGRLGPRARIELSMATTLSRARVLLRNTSGSVYHPTNSQNCFGKVHERVQAYNLRLEELASCTKFQPSSASETVASI